MPIVAGPEFIDTLAANDVCSFFYPRPVFINNGTDRFCFLLKTAGVNWQLKAYLRNNGAGTWTEQNVGGGPAVARLVGGNDVFGCPTYIKDPLNPTTVIAAYPRASDSTLAFVVFDMVAKTFGVPITGGPLVTKVDVNFAGPPAAVYSDDTGGKCCVAYRPLDDKFVFAYQGPIEVVGGANCLRPYYVTATRAGVWSAATQLGFAGVHNPFSPVGIVTDQTTSKSYVAIVKPNGGTNATTQEIWFAQIDSNDTINAPVIMTNDVRRDREPYIGYPTLQNKGGNTIFNVVYFSEDATHTIFKIRAARCLVAPAPAVVLEDISGSGLPNGPGGNAFICPAIAIGSDNNPYVIWMNLITPPNFEPKVWLSIGGAIGDPWSVPSNIFTVLDPVNDFAARPNFAFMPGI